MRLNCFTLIEATPPAAVGGVAFLIFNRYLRNWFFPNFHMLSVLGSTALILGISGLWMIHHDLHRDSVKSLSVIVLLFLSGLLGSYTATVTADRIINSFYSGISVLSVKAITVELRSDPRLISKGRWVAEGVLMDTERDDVISNAKGLVTIFCSKDYSSLGKGRYVQLSGSLKKSERQNGLIIGAEGGYVFFCDTYVPGHWKNSFFSFRHRITSEMESRLYSGSMESGSLLTALLLGRKTSSGVILVEQFKKAGCIHILALSGFHVGLIAFALRSLFKPVVGYVAASIASAVGAIAFLLFIGLRPSLFRAVIMYVLYIWNSIRGYRISPLNYLSAAYLLQSVIFPLSVYSLSFQLSYAALAGLLICGKAYYRILHRYIPGNISAAIGAGLGAQLFTLPLINSSFGIWYPVGILAAPFLAFLSAWEMALGGIRMLFPISSPVGWIISSILDFLTGIIFLVTGIFSFIPPVVISMPLSWLIASLGTILPVILIRSIYREKPSCYQSRLPSLHPSLSRQSGIGSSKEVGAELSYQSRSPQKNHFFT